jgi:uncharacterized protein YeaC (DUF1315 family)
MNRLFEIASELGEIARKRLSLRQIIDGMTDDIAMREAELIPEGGWPGGNADTRKAMEKAAKAADIILQGRINYKSTSQKELDALEVDRDVLNAERDAWQWTIRDRETTKPLDGHESSVFEDYDLWQDEQYSRARDGKVS